MVFDGRSWSVIDEVLIMRGMHSASQVPLLNQHSMRSVFSVLGSVRDIRVEGERVLGRCHFAEDEDSERAWLKVRDKHLTAVSIGYMPRKDRYIDIAPGQSAEYEGRTWTAGERTLRVTAEWDLFEVSLVVIGADPQAQIRSQETGKCREEMGAGVGAEDDIGGRENGDEAMRNWRMGLAAVERRLEAHKEAGGVEQRSVEQRKAVETPVAAVEERRTEVDAVARERGRAGEIVTLAARHGASDALRDRALETGMTADQFGRAVLEEIQERRTVAVPRVTGMVDGREGLTRALSSAVALGAGYRPRDEKERASAEEFRGIRLRQLCELCLRAEGKEVPLRNEEMFGRALSTLSLPHALGDSAHKVLLSGYDSVPSTALRIASHLSASDFKSHKLIVLSPMSRLAQVGPAGQFDMGGFTEGSNTFQIDTYARGFGIGRQDVINDDLGAFTRAGRMMGVAAKLTLNSNWIATLVSNSGVGPTMAEDSEALFSASHTSGSNYSTGVATTLSEAGLETAKKLLRSQKSLGDTEGETMYTNATSRYLLVPAILETKALKWMNSVETHVAASTSEGTKNVFQSMAEVVVEAALDAATDGTTAWYLFADPANEMNATLALSFLNGVETPVVETLPQQDPLSFRMLVYHDWGIDAVGHRGAVRSKGAA
jgi:HK97 family phage prohead protease